MQQFGMPFAAESSDARFAGSYGADMYADTIEGFAKVAEKKLAALRRAPGGFFVASMLAGAYVGIGIILIFTLGQLAPPEIRKLVMGATFGIALTLVVIAGAELFTGHTMFM